MYIQGEMPDWVIVTNEHQHGWHGTGMPPPVLGAGMTIAEAFANYTMFVMSFVASLLPRPAPGASSVNGGAGRGWRSTTRATRSRRNIDSLGNFSSFHAGTGLRQPVVRLLSAPASRGLVLPGKTEAQGD